MTPIIALIGPSQSGKSELIKRIVERLPSLRIIKSVTTRPRRDTPDDDLFYEHIDESVFRFLERDNALAQSIAYAGNLYGTRKDELEREGMGIYALVEESVKQLKRNGYAVTSIRIIPDSYELTMDAARRHADTLRSMAGFKADYIIHNSFTPGGLDKALGELQTIIRGIV